MLKWLAAAAAVMAVALPLALLLLVAVAADPGQARRPRRRPECPGPVDYPAVLPGLYLAAARTCPGLPWSVLAGIGKVESDHGRSDAPGVHSGANFAGAEGPMQFEPATFARVRGQRRPHRPAEPVRPGRRDLHGRGDAVRRRRGRRALRPGSGRRSSPTTTPPPTSPTSWPGPPATPSPPRRTPPSTAIAFALASSASPTSGAPPARTPSTAPAWSTPPTPRPGSRSPGPRSSGARTARRSRCPRSSPVTCCSPPARTAPRPTRVTS